MTTDCYEVLKYALCDIDAMLRDGYDIDVEEFLKGPLAQEALSGLPNTIREISSLLQQSLPTANWLKETYPSLCDK